MNNLLSNRRKLLKKTQLDIYIDTNVSERTIRNFENYIATPSIYILKKLSKGYLLNPIILQNIKSSDVNFLNIDLYDLICNSYRANESPDKIKDTIEFNKSLLEASDITSFEFIFYRQYLEFLSGLHNIYIKNYQKALNYFINSIRVTICTFDLDNIFNSIQYVSSFSRLEIRILYELANSLFYLDKTNLSYLITSEIIKNINTTWDFYNEILCQHSINLSRENKLVDSMHYINEAILFSKNNFLFKNLPLYYFNRAIIKKKLNQLNYKEDILLALEICKSLDLDNIKQSIISKCDKFSLL